MSTKAIPVGGDDFRIGSQQTPMVEGKPSDQKSYVETVQDAWKVANAKARGRGRVKQPTTQDVQALIAEKTGSLEEGEPLDLGEVEAHARRELLAKATKEQEAKEVRRPDRYTTTDSLRFSSAPRCDHCGDEPEDGMLGGDPNGAGRLCRACHPYPATFDIVGMRVG